VVVVYGHGIFRKVKQEECCNVAALHSRLL
jgi:hypothetical protein